MNGNENGVGNRDGNRDGDASCLLAFSTGFDAAVSARALGGLVITDVKLGVRR